MENKTLFYCILTMIIILLIFNVKIVGIGDKMDKSCNVYYNSSENCPCEKVAPDKFSSLENISHILVYTQNFSPS